MNALTFGTDGVVTPIVDCAELVVMAVVGTFIRRSASLLPVDLLHPAAFHFQFGHSFSCAPNRAGNTGLISKPLLVQSKQVTSDRGR